MDTRLFVYGDNDDATTTQTANIYQTAEDHYHSSTEQCAKLTDLTYLPKLLTSNPSKHNQLSIPFSY